jgi:hypothetical protein
MTTLYPPIPSNNVFVIKQECSFFVHSLITGDSLRRVELKAFNLLFHILGRACMTEQTENRLVILDILRETDSLHKHSFRNFYWRSWYHVKLDSDTENLILCDYSFAWNIVLLSTHCVSVFIIVFLVSKGLDSPMIALHKDSYNNVRNNRK